jgi:hypothetical protein
MGGESGDHEMRNGIPKSDPFATHSHALLSKARYPTSDFSFHLSAFCFLLSNPPSP